MDAETAGRVSRLLESLDAETEGRRRTPRKEAWEPVLCEACSRLTTEPVRGLCRACYQKTMRGSPAGPGASCVGCGSKDMRALHAYTIGGIAVACCRNCSWVARHARPALETVEDLAQLVMRPGDRRRRGDRRGPRDRRGPVGDRRLSREGAGDRREGEERRTG
jgi:hypothetical protein